MAATGQRTAVVIGGAGGIGLATASRLAEDGHRIALVDFAHGPLDAARAALLERFPDCTVTTSVADVSSVDSVAAAAEEIARDHGAVHALALVAGVLQEAGSVAMLPSKEWDRVHAVNLRGPFVCAQAFLPHMPDHAGAAIVTIASWWGRSGHALFSAYCSSKAGLISLTQCLADELAPRGIRANVICPGNVDTGMHRKALEEEAAQRGLTFEEMKDLEWAKIPLGYAGPPSAIADSVAFLLSERASYVTGASLDVNGGVLFH
jgi:3-oxoacyl-[acyl-carrier protein] reductase